MKTPGQLAYERDMEKYPTYQDARKTPRKTWNQLPQFARDSWERNPTNR